MQNNNLANIAQLEKQIEKIQKDRFVVINNIPVFTTSLTELRMNFL